MFIFCACKMNNYNIYKIKSNFIPFGICLLILMVILSIAIFSNVLLELSLYNSPVVLDLKDDIDKTQKDRLIKFLHNDAIVNQSSIEYIDKSVSSEHIGKMIDSSLHQKIDSLNVFKDLILFKIKQQSNKSNIREEFLDILKEMDGISEINTAADSILDQSSWMRNARILSIPIILFFTIILILIIRSLVNNNLDMNKKTLQTLSLVGQTKRSIFNSYLNQTAKVLLRSWILAVLLFLLFFYLLISRFNISFYDIGDIKLITVLILPLIIFILTIAAISNSIIRESLKQK